MTQSADSERPTGNLLLDSLSAQERASLRLRPVAFSLGEVIYESHEAIGFACFPTTCVASCLYTTQSGATAETALVGNDGILGMSLLFADGTNTHRAVAQVGGDALKISAATLQSEFARGGTFQRVLLRYTQALITQISQTAVCNRLHPLEQRLCRWLLLCRDRVARSDFLMTQEFIANMLGGRRESVTVAAGHLQDLGLIQYARGHINIIDRKGLERMACECYAAVNASATNGSQSSQPRFVSASDRSVRDDEALFSTGRNSLAG